MCSLWFAMGVFANEDVKLIQPFVKGSFASLCHQQTSPYLVVFWSETCQYCFYEMKAIGELQHSAANIFVVTVATDPFLPAETVNEIHRENQLNTLSRWVFAEPYPEGLYFDIDQHWRGELPRTYFVDKNCQATGHSGVIKKKDILDWFNQQEMVLTADR